MKKTNPSEDRSAADLITARIVELEGWRGRALARMRRLILASDAGVIEEWKWGGPVWSCDGIICTGESYKNAVKLTFPKGASLEDPTGIFNASLEGNARRALDLHEGDVVDPQSFTALVREAIAVNRSAKGKSSNARSAKPAARRPAK